MRFLKGVLTILLFLAGVVGVVWLVGPEIIVGWGAIQLRDEVVNLKSSTAKSGSVTGCVDKLGGRKREPVDAYQIRFENETDYVIEAVCSSMAKGNIQLKQKKLPFKVGKDKGYGGIRWSVLGREETTSYVVISYLKRRWQVGIVEGKVVARRIWLDPIDEVTAVANNTCRGWGYLCCSLVNQVGAGKSLAKNVLDCPASCAEVCLNRPNVITFMSEPYYNENRVVELVGGSRSVDFSWKAQDMDGTITKVVLDFGDGGQEESVESTGTVTHEYACDQDGCWFEATLTVMDNDGLESSLGVGSKISVMVRN